jgi:hypothetical protein
MRISSNEPTMDKPSYIERRPARKDKSGPAGCPNLLDP